MPKLSQALRDIALQRELTEEEVWEFLPQLADDNGESYPTSLSREQVMLLKASGIIRYCGFCTRHLIRDWPDKDDDDAIAEYHFSWPDQELVQRVAALAEDAARLAVIKDNTRKALMTRLQDCHAAQEELIRDIQARQEHILRAYHSLEMGYDSGTHAMDSDKTAQAKSEIDAMDLNEGTVIGAMRIARECQSLAGTFLGEMRFPLGWGKEEKASPQE